MNNKQLTLDLQVFEYENHSKIRSLYINGEVWFYGIDACHVLGIKNPSDAYGRLDKDDLGTTEGMDKYKRKQNYTIISGFSFPFLRVMLIR